MANRTLGQMVLGAFGENLERKFPQHIAKRLKDADDDNGIVGVLHDLYCAIPAEAGIVFDFAAQFVKHRGPVGLLFGEFLESIPAVSDDLRLMKNKTPEGARADLIKHYENWKKEHKMSNPIKAVFEEKTDGKKAEEKPDDKTVVEEKKAEKQEVAKARVDWAKAVTKNFTNETHRKVVIAIADLCYTDGLPGNDYVAELDGSAHYALKAWYDATINIPDEVAEGFATDDVNVKTLARLATARALDLKNPANNQELMAVRQQLFHDNFDAIRLALLNHLSNHPENAVEAGIKDALDGMSKLAGFLPGGKGTIVAQVKQFAIDIAGLSIWINGLVIVYLALVLVAIAFGWTQTVAWVSFAVLIVAPAVGMMVGHHVYGKTDVAKLMFRLFCTFMSQVPGPILTAVAFGADSLFAEEIHWSSIAMEPTLVVLWAIVSVGVPQKIINVLGSFETLVVSFVSKDAVASVKEQLEKMQFLSKVADTIMYANLLMWVVVVALSGLRVMDNSPITQNQELGILFGVALFALLGMSQARVLVHNLLGKKDPTEKLRDTNALNDATVISRVQRYWIPLVLVAVGLFVLATSFGYVQDLQPWKARLSAVGSNQAEKGMTWVEEKTGTPHPTAQTNGGNAASGATGTSGTGTATAPVTGKAHKSKHDKMCDAMGGAAMCAEHGQDFGPCPCN